jgi:hypothetical protein
MCVTREASFESKKRQLDGSLHHRQDHFMNSPVTPWVLAGRIFSIIGMSLAAALGILFFVGAFWWWGLAAIVGFVPFFVMIVLVEKYSAKHGLIGPEPSITVEPE